MKVLPHYIRVPFLILGISDIAVCFGAIFLAGLIRFESEMFQIYLDSGWLTVRALLFATIMYFSLLAVGLYQASFRESLAGVLVRVVFATFLGAVALIIIFYSVPVIFVGRGVLGLGLGLSLVGLMVNRAVFYSVLEQHYLKKRVLVVGAGEKAGSIFKQMRRKSDMRGFQIIGFVAIAGEQLVIDEQYLVHMEDGLTAFVRDNNIQEIVVAVDDRRKDFPLHELLDCKLRNIEIVDILTFIEREAGKVRLDMLHPSWMIFSNGFQISYASMFTKRLVDVGISLLILVFTWPVMLIVAITILVESRGQGPIFYRQVRVGLDGNVFNIIKFRSMRSDAEMDGNPQWAAQNDNRVTSVGAIHRKYRLDELPQLFNVLRGEMSLVGPRPERPEFVNELSDAIPYYQERHRMKPGISGWAQLRYPYGASMNDTIEKLQFDLYYIKNHSLFLDLTIMVQTVEVILFAKGGR